MQYATTVYCWLFLPEQIENLSVTDQFHAGYCPLWCVAGIQEGVTYHLLYLAENSTGWVYILHTEIWNKASTWPFKSYM